MPAAKRSGCAPTSSGRRKKWRAGGRADRAALRRALAGIRAARPTPSAPTSCAPRSAMRWARTRSASRGSASDTRARWARGRTPAPSRWSRRRSAPAAPNSATIARSIAAVDTLEAFLRDLRARYPETGAMPARQQATQPPAPPPRHRPHRRAAPPRARPRSGITTAVPPALSRPRRSSRLGWRRARLAPRGRAKVPAHARGAGARFIADVRELEQRDRKLSPPRAPAEARRRRALRPIRAGAAADQRLR